MCELRSFSILKQTESSQMMESSSSGGGGASPDRLRRLLLKLPVIQEEEPDECLSQCSRGGGGTARARSPWNSNGINYNNVNRLPAPPPPQEHHQQQSQQQQEESGQNSQTNTITTYTTQYSTGMLMEPSALARLNLSNAGFRTDTGSSHLHGKTRKRLMKAGGIGNPGDTMSSARTGTWKKEDDEDGPMDKWDHNYYYNDYVPSPDDPLKQYQWSNRTNYGDAMRRQVKQRREEERRQRRGCCFFC